MLDSNTWKNLPVYKRKIMSLLRFKNIINKMSLEIIYLIEIYENELALN